MGLFLPGAVVITDDQAIGLGSRMLVGVGQGAHCPTLIWRGECKAIQATVSDVRIDLAPACAIVVQQRGWRIAIKAITHRDTVVNPADPYIAIGPTCNRKWRNRG